MHSISSLLSSLLPALTLASPLLTSRQADFPTANITLCTGAHYTGTCESFSLPFAAAPAAPFTECVQLDSSLSRNVGSFKVAPGAYCRTTSVDNCANLGSGEAMVFPPGNEDFRNVEGSDLGGRTVSLKCQKCTACE